MSYVAAAVLWFTVTCYAVLGGADFGAGFWDLLAGGRKRGAKPRALVDHAMAPVWEANNVWLIFALVVLWTAFPRAFAAIMSSLYVPLALAALGIVLRGASFAFGKVTQAITGRRIFNTVFSVSSVMTPFFLGAAFGAIASGRVPLGGTPGPVDWLGPTPVLVGVLAVLCSAFLAAVFLVFDARRTLDEELERYFRRRAVASAALVGAVALAGLFILRADAPHLLHRLLRQGLPLALLSAAAGAGVLVLLSRGITQATRVLAVAAVASMLWAWGVAQHPFMLPPSLTIDAAAGAPATLKWLVVVFVIAALTVGPALALLWLFDQQSRLEAGTATTGAHPRHRVVVVGGGFGGLFAARALGWSPVDVTVIDRQPHHLFQPLLYQVATGILSEGEVAPSLRHVFRFQRNAAVVLAEVTGFDLQKRLVHARRPDGVPLVVPYDSLVVAAGAGQSYFGHDEFAAHTVSMKTLEDALGLRRRLLQALEMAELAQDPKERQEWLTIAVVGAGPTGVEISGQVKELVQAALGTNTRSTGTIAARVVLLDAGKEPLVHFGEKLAETAAKELARLGVELHMGAKVKRIDDRGLVLDGPAGEERIDARTVVWAAGVEASPLARMLGEASGAVCDRSGRIEVQPDCSLPHYEEVFAIGDMTSLSKLPGVAEVAMQEGLHAARIIRRRVAGHTAPPPPFRYHDVGSMATVGRFRAVVSLRGLKIGGFLGWLMWLVVHLTFLTGFTSRLGALAHWAFTFVGKGRAQLAFSARFDNARK
jgi:NADH dehydrogenase